jgi:hypothetical protein
VARAQTDAQSRGVSNASQKRRPSGGGSWRAGGLEAGGWRLEAGQLGVLRGESSHGPSQKRKWHKILATQTDAQTDAQSRGVDSVAQQNCSFCNTISRRLGLRRLRVASRATPARRMPLAATPQSALKAIRHQICRSRGDRRTGVNTEVLPLLVVVVCLWLHGAFWWLTPLRRCNVGAVGAVGA